MTPIIITTSTDHDAIATRAYYLWEAEGCPDGRHEAHWLTAEAAEKRSLKARRAAATRKTKAAAAEAKPVALPKASPAVLVAAAAVSKSRGAGSRTTRRVH